MPVTSSLNKKIKITKQKNQRRREKKNTGDFETLAPAACVFLRQNSQLQQCLPSPGALCLPLNSSAFPKTSVPAPDFPTPFWLKNTARWVPHPSPHLYSHPEHHNGFRAVPAATVHRSSTVPQCLCQVRKHHWHRVSQLPGFSSYTGFPIMAKTPAVPSYFSGLWWHPQSTE